MLSPFLHVCLVVLPAILQTFLAACEKVCVDNRKHEKKPPAVSGLDIAVLDTWAAQQQGKGSPLEGIGAFGAGASNCTPTNCEGCCRVKPLCSLVVLLGGCMSVVWK